MNRSNLLTVAIALVLASLLAPGKAHADCHMMAGLGWGSLAGLGVGAIAGGIAGGKVFDSASQGASSDTGANTQAVSTGAKVLGAVIFGVIGAVVGGAVGFGTGAVLCLVENPEGVPVYAYDHGLPTPPGREIIMARSSSLADEIAALSDRQPAVFFRQATLLDPETLVAYPN